MGSYDVGKAEVCKWIRQTFPSNSVILDVGACDGKWHSLLPEYTMDAVEIFAPYIKWLSGYRQVFVEDICAFQYDFYDLVIFGDVIEHMSVQSAQSALAYAKQHCRDLIVAVPFLYEQDEVDGNKWQRHIQDDLTADLFNERYPGMAELYRTDDYCYYHLQEGGAGC